jgi:hypothetical protein
MIQCDNWCIRSFLFCECIHNEILVAISICHTKTNWQHEFGGVKTYLDRAEKISR